MSSASRPCSARSSIPIVLRPEKPSNPPSQKIGLSSISSVQTMTTAQIPRASLRVCGSAEKMRAIILPNNRKVLTILDANSRHLNAAERKTVEAFRQHIDDLEAKHISEGNGDVASRFPVGMSDVLAEV